MARTQAQKNRAERQEALREYLNERIRLGKVIENIEKIEGLSFDPDGDYKELSAVQFDLQKLKTANEQRLKLINKYLPELKSQELTGEGGEPFVIHVEYRHRDI